MNKEHSREIAPQVEETHESEILSAEREQNSAEQLSELGENIERSAAQAHDSALIKSAEIAGYAEKRGAGLTREEDDDNMTLLTRSKRSYDNLKRRVARAQRRLVGAIALTASMMAGEAPPTPEAEPRPDMPTVVEFDEDEVVEAAAPQETVISEQEYGTEEVAEAEPEPEHAAERPTTERVRERRAVAAAEAEPEPESGPDMVALIEEAAGFDRRYSDGPMDMSEYAALAAEGKLESLQTGGGVEVYAIEGQRDAYVMVEEGRNEAYTFRSRDPETAQEFARNFSQHDVPTRRLLSAFRRQEQVLEDRGLLARSDGRHGETVPDSTREIGPGLTTHIEVRAVYDEDGDVVGITEWTMVDAPEEMDEEDRRRWNVPDDGVRTYRFISPQDSRYDGYADVLDVPHSGEEGVADSWYTPPDIPSSPALDAVFGDSRDESN